MRLIVWCFLRLWYLSIINFICVLISILTLLCIKCNCVTFPLVFCMFSTFIWFISGKLIKYDWWSCFLSRSFWSVDCVGCCVHGKGQDWLWVWPLVFSCTHSPVQVHLLHCTRALLYTHYCTHPLVSQIIYSTCFFTDHWSTFYM